MNPNILDDDRVLNMTMNELRKTIQSLKDAQSKTRTNSSEYSVFQRYIDKNLSRERKAINICKNDIIKYNLLGDGSPLNPSAKLEVLRLTKNNFENLSVVKWNTLIRTTLSSAKDSNGNFIQEHESNEITPDNHGDRMVDFLEGKSGITLTTGVKAAVTTAAVASLCSLNIANFASFLGLSTVGLPKSLSLISVVGKAVGGAFALNPVLGIAAGALLATGTLKLAKKIFGPEIKKMWGNFKAQRKIDKIVEQNEVDITPELDGLDENDFIQKQEKLENYNLELAELETNDATLPEIKAFIDKFEKTKLKPKREIIANVKPAIEKAFKIEASAFIFNYDETKYNIVKKNYASYLSPTEISKIEAEIQLQTKTDLKSHIDDYKNVKSSLDTETKTDFNKFKKELNNIIANFNSADAQTVLNNIKKLSAYTDGSKLRGTKDIDKVKTLCGDMEKLLQELYLRVKVNGKNADIKSIAAEQGLTENDLNDLGITTN